MAPAGTPQQKRALASFVRYTDTQTHISDAWMSGFYPIYAQAQSAFGVNWLLLASIHRQESAFSTAPGIYHGLNFAGCCGGPMQFNVTNGGRAKGRRAQGGGNPIYMATGKRRLPPRQTAGGL